MSRNVLLEAIVVLVGLQQSSVLSPLWCVIVMDGEEKCLTFPSPEHFPWDRTFPSYLNVQLKIQIQHV